MDITAPCQEDPLLAMDEQGHQIPAGKKKNRAFRAGDTEDAEKEIQKELREQD